MTDGIDDASPGGLANDNEKENNTVIPHPTPANLELAITPAWCDFAQMERLVKPM